VQGRKKTLPRFPIPAFEERGGLQREEDSTPASKGYKDGKTQSYRNEGGERAKKKASVSFPKKWEREGDWA